MWTWTAMVTVCRVRTNGADIDCPASRWFTAWAYGNLFFVGCVGSLCGNKTNGTSLFVCVVYLVGKQDARGREGRARLPNRCTACGRHFQRVQVQMPWLAA